MRRFVRAALTLRQREPIATRAWVLRRPGARLPGELQRQAEPSRPKMTPTGPAPRPAPALSRIEREALEAWERGGSMSLGLWLAHYKEATTGRRNFTTSEYGQWVQTVRRLSGEA